MYVPNHFKEDDQEKLQQYIRGYSFGDAPTEYTEGLMRAIVGVEIQVDTLTGKLKASQKQPERNRAGVKAGLEAPAETQSVAMARLIR